MNPCARQQTGAVELYFYDELQGGERESMARHLGECRECAAALEELQMIREALASRRDVSAPAGGDWSRFMSRLDAAINSPVVVPFVPRKAASVRRYVGLLATAALLAIVTMSVYFVARQRPAVEKAPIAAATPGEVAVATTGLRAAGEKHFERSKLVVLGIANRDTDAVVAADWAYERQLASSLLNDTRLYRMAAEQHGLTRLAGVMRDLELVLLETSMAEGSEAGELGQIQRLIEKRNLIEKMDAVATAGM